LESPYHVDDDLSDPVAWIDNKGLAAQIQKKDANLIRIIGIDRANAIGECDLFFNG